MNEKSKLKNHQSLGVLLVNTGTPASPDPKDVRHFLAEFLSDPQVINYPRWLWKPLLYGVILRVRPRRSARLYRRIWTESGSPLLLGTQSLAGKIEKNLSTQFGGFTKVISGMRYGEPSVATALRILQKHAVERILVLPLFPQYSGTTTGTILRAVLNELHTWTEVPAITIIRDYHDHSAYVQALVKSIQKALQGWSHLLFSFHGIPRSYVEAGDPYECQCQRTSSLVSQALDLKPEEWSLAFQSRFGPNEWLTPYTEKELTRLGGEGEFQLNVICPGFAIDCLETLDEIANEGAKTFQNAGGGGFNYIPALNDHPDHVSVLTEIIISTICEGIS